MMKVLVLCLGFLYTLRAVSFDAQMSGNTLARQKDTQVADIALRTSKDHHRTQTLLKLQAVYQGSRDIRG